MFVDFVQALWPGSPHTVFALGRTGGGAASFVDCFQTHLVNLSVDLFLCTRSVARIRDFRIARARNPLRSCV